MWDRWRNTLLIDHIIQVSVRIKGQKSRPPTGDRAFLATVVSLSSVEGPNLHSLPINEGAAVGWASSLRQVGGEPWQMEAPPRRQPREGLTPARHDPYLRKQGSLPSGIPWVDPYHTRRKLCPSWRDVLPPLAVSGAVGEPRLGQEESGTKGVSQEKHTRGALLWGVHRDLPPQGHSLGTGPDLGQPGPHALPGSLGWA